MTTSTAPITVVAKHRQAHPVWVFHVALLWIAYAARRAAYPFDVAGYRIDLALAAAPRWVIVTLAIVGAVLGASIAAAALAALKALGA